MITFVLVLGLKNRSNGIENQTKFSFGIFCQFKENQHDPTQYSRFILNLLLASKRCLSLRNVKTWRGHRKRLSPFLLPGLQETRQDQIQWIQFCSNETVKKKNVSWNWVDFLRTCQNNVKKFVMRGRGNGIRTEVIKNRACLNRSEMK